MTAARSSRLTSIPKPDLEGARDPGVRVLDASRRADLARRVVATAIFVTLPLAVGGMVSSCGSGGASPPVAPAPSDTPTPGPSPALGASDQLLFVLTATRGQVLPSSDGAPRTLRFDGVDPSLLAFADRPIRIAATQPTTRLFADWAQYGFAAVPPNAAIVVTGTAVRDPVAIELRNPRYDGASGTLEVDAASLAGDASDALATVLDASGRDGRTVVIFIDATADTPGPVQASPEDVSAVVDLVQQLVGVTFTAEQRDLLANGASALCAINQSPQDQGDPALVAQNVDLFIDDVQQVLGVSFDSDQHRLLTRALMQLVGDG